MKYGISYQDYWEMDLREIKIVLNELITKENEHTKELAVFDHKLADLVGISIGRIFSKKNKYPELEEAYPNLFDDEEKNEEAQVLKLKNNLIRFAEAHNRQRQEEQLKKENEKIMLDLLEERFNEGLELSEDELALRKQLRKANGLPTIDIEEIDNEGKD